MVTIENSMSRGRRDSSQVPVKVVRCVMRVLPARVADRGGHGEWGVSAGQG